MTKVVDDVRQRKKFPRLTTAANAIACEKLVWTEPEVRILFCKKCSATQFILTIPVPPEFRKSQALPYQMIFEHFDWEKAVREAYDEGMYGGKDIPTYVSDGLHKVFIDAIGKWRRYVRALAHDSDLAPPEALDRLLVGEFKDGPKRKTGPQPNAHAAWRAARRFKSLLPKVSALRRSFKGRTDLAKKRDLAAAIEEVAPWDTVCSALTAILAEQKSIQPLQFLTPELSNHKITSAIVQVELEQKGFDFRRNSFRTYHRLGRKLLELLADDSTSVSTKTARPR
jgi:hypothetical protein